MALKDYSDLNEYQLDALREIGNIGSGNAATALSDMLDRSVTINVPTIHHAIHAGMNSSGTIRTTAGKSAP